MTVSSFEVEKSHIVPRLKKRQYAEALRMLEEAHPRDRAQRLEQLEMQAMCYFRTAQFEQAAECYRQLAEEDPESARPLINLGAVYNRLHRYSEAIESLRKAIQRDRCNVDAYYNLGFAQRHSGHPDLAISAYKEALRLRPNMEQGHLNLGNAYLEVKNTVMATNHYKAALEIDPELEPAKRGLVRAAEQELKNRESKNPFGRLVDPAQLTRQRSDSAAKNLSEAEREKDRQEVQQLAKSVRNAARQASEELRDKMQPALMAMTRALVQGEHRPDHIEATHDKFHTELPRFKEAMRALRYAMLELRGHEEIMNTPDIDV
ncbi:tetratricopeptide repeat protein [bacterium]|uniref:Tetratricopeptide TPR_1 repeat-containing protein n=1 Tax=Rubinisphaera brasiliensis (strain ATCC 49424 / DSM 5305 / JCM 21570 / IAM 15109 / NBRC 103401 / IFAM 1448) TaxID=756272 RepID=F0SIM2_RUBBR|nr:tetratricopeptide repeat protein [Rubinisphaera brasiliensis]ADY59650.1 Tetratricopeptide TPR_1 repeat-containing protein [Rubinisphaera brasiliensis DSM 5305]MBR9803809.1 tetratricopeptide repeat protein [bacterium]